MSRLELLGFDRTIPMTYYENKKHGQVSWALRHRLSQVLYVLVDYVGSMLVWLLFLYFRWKVLDERVTGFDEFMAPAFDFSFTNSYHPIFLYPLGCAIVYYFSGYYLRPGKKRVSSLIGNTLFSALLISFGAFFTIIVDDVQVADMMRYYKSLMVLVALQFGIILACRLLVYYTYQQHTRRERVSIKWDKDMTEQKLYQLINELFPQEKEIAIEPRMYDILTGAARIVHIDESPMIVVTEPHMRDWELVVKRSFDIVVSLVGLVVLSPVFLVLAIIVRLDSPGPIIYSQERIGLWGRPFCIYKFRTMVVNAEVGTPMLSHEGDERITRTGRWLRKYRLDELPQLWNILRGDMSIVGPRPERRYFVEKIMEHAPYYCLLYKVRPGLTSWGPVRVGYTDTMEKMLQRLTYDVTYTENMSIILDIKIMLRTIGVLVDGKGQ